MKKHRSILIINHTSVLKLYQKKLGFLSHNLDFDYTLLIPQMWPESGFPTRAEKTTDSKYRIEVARIFFPGSGTRYFFRGTIGRLIKELQPDIIDLVEEPWGAVCAQALFNRNRHSPHSKLLFHTSRTQVMKYPPPFPQFEKRFLKASSFGICRSEKAETLLKTRGFSGPTAVITHGVDLNTFKTKEVPQLKKQLGLKSVPTIAYIGGIKKAKGLVTLVEALKQVEGDFNFLVVGSGPFEPTFRELIKHNNLADKTYFVPAVSQAAVADYLNLADIMVLPSLTTPLWEEMFGRILTEAMAVGVPIIGSDSGAIPRVVDEAGLIFPEGDVTALQAAIQQLLDDPAKRERLVDLGKKRVHHYSWQTVSRKIEAVYQQLLS